MTKLRDGRYLSEGVSYPRVSSILAILGNDALAAWRVRIGAEEAERISTVAREHGTRLHAALEWVNQTGPRRAAHDRPAELDGLERPIARYLEWAAEHIAAVVSTERTVVSREFGFAGTLDALAELRTGELAILDYKTSKVGDWDSRRPEWAMQLSAYRLALAEDGLIAKRRIVLQLPSNEIGRLDCHEFTEHKADTLAFLACLDLYRWLEAWRKANRPAPRRPGVERASPQLRPVGPKGAP